MTYVHIHAPRGYYIGQVRLIGHQKWESVTGKLKSAEKALATAVLKMSPNHKRARVLFITYDGWYEPNIVMECKR